MVGGARGPDFRDRQVELGSLSSLGVEQHGTWNRDAAGMRGNWWAQIVASRPQRIRSMRANRGASLSGTKNGGWCTRACRAQKEKSNSQPLENCLKAGPIRDSVEYHMGIVQGWRHP